MSNIMSRLFSSKCTACGANVKDPVLAPVVAGLGRKAKVCRSCADGFRGGDTALIKASYGSDEDVVQTVKSLLTKGADVNTRDENGGTALMVASWYGNLALAKLLIANGADINAMMDDGTTALIETSRRGASRELAKFLLANGANPNVRYKGQGDNRYAIIKVGTTPLLMWASFEGTSDICKALLKRGADVNARDDQDRDALMLASKNRDSELMQLLRARGASGAAEAEAEARQKRHDAEVAKEAEAYRKRRDAELAAELAEAKRLEAEAIAKGDLLPRTSEPTVSGDQSEGTFRAVGLTWQLDPALSEMYLEDAESYAAKLTLAGGSWRLPTVHELDALYKAKILSPVIVSYPGMNKGWYWSGSPHPDGNTFCVNFKNGSVAGNVNGKAISVRCVIRDAAKTEASQGTKQANLAQKPPKVAVAGEQSERTFFAAGLTWQLDPAPWKMDWEDAKSYAARLTLAGGGWRLPTVRELETLYQATLSSPTIAAYLEMDEGWYWSASPSESDPTRYIWGVNFSTKRGGEVTGHDTTCTEAVRCVRT